MCQDYISEKGFQKPEEALLKVNKSLRVRVRTYPSIYNLLKEHSDRAAVDILVVFTVVYEAT